MNVQDIIGIDRSFNVFYGYDCLMREACIEDPYLDVYDPIVMWTKEDKVDLANKMINRWETYRKECNET